MDDTKDFEAWWEKRIEDLFEDATPRDKWEARKGWQASADNTQAKMVEEIVELIEDDVSGDAITLDAIISAIRERYQKT